MIPAILWTSVSFSMIKSIFPAMVERALENSFEEYPKAKGNEDLQDSMVFEVLAFLGIGQIVGGILIGFSRDACGNKFAIIF